MAYWKAVTRSYPGTNHIRTGKLRQDYAAYEILSKSLLIGAVADGAENASHSRIGVGLAVRNVLFYLRKAFQSDVIYPPKTEAEALTWFGNLSDLIKADLKKFSDTNHVYLRDLACTLLSFIVTPQHMVAMQIGEGCVVIRTHESQEYRLLFEPKQRSFNQQETFVTDPNARQEMHIKVLNEPVSFICAATKGMVSVALRSQEWSPYTSFFSSLERYMEGVLNPKLSPQYLEAFLTSNKLSQCILEDRTLLLARLILENSNHSIFSNQNLRDINRLGEKRFYN